MARVTAARRATEARWDAGYRQLKPIKWWAASGFAFVALQLYIYIAWLTSGNVKPTPTGPTPVPTYMRVAAHTWEAVGTVAAAVLVYWFVIKPWRRDRRPSFEGLLCLAFVTIMWQDPLLNYTQIQFAYSSELIQVGSWAGNIPGFLPHDGHLLPEPVFFVGAGYIYWVFGFTLIGSAIMRKAKARWPHLGKLGLVTACFLAIAVVEILLELIVMRLGMYTYGGSIKWMTLFHGHFYQYPLTEWLFSSFVFVPFASLYYFRNDKGQTVVERGIDELHVTSRQKTWLRFLALTGILNILFLAGYNIPMQWSGSHADAWPKDISMRSYFTVLQCGPGTTYACPGPGIPIVRPDSVHVSPEGKLVVPGRTKD